MPLTPLHFTATAWLFFKSKTRIDLSALAISSMIPDLEPLGAIILGLPETHQVWHSFLSALLLPIPLSLVIWLSEHRAKGLVHRGYKFLRLRNVNEEYPFGTILVTCLIGWSSHVFFDMWTHKTFRFVFYPLILDTNPFWFQFRFALIVEFVVLLLSAYSVILWVRHVSREVSSAQPLSLR